MVVKHDFDFKWSDKLAVAGGFFDGVHRGHSAVINTALSYREKGYDVGVFSFTVGDNAPQKLKSGLIFTDDIKQSLIAETGAQLYICPDFSYFSSMSPDSFVKALADLGVAVFCCGRDFRFGVGASAGVEELKTLGGAYGIDIHITDDVQTDGKTISSTEIRRLLRDGKVEEANILLGRDYFIKSPILHGSRLGRTIGFPTANQIIPDKNMVLKNGVYATVMEIDGACYPAVTNVGVRPTVGGDGVTSEGYIIGFDGDIYDKVIVTRFKKFLRSEQKFETVEKLGEAIGRDAKRRAELFAQGI